LILALIVFCAGVCLVAGILVWQMDDVQDTVDPIVGQPSPTPVVPVDGPPDAVALLTEARLNDALVPIHYPAALHSLFDTGEDGPVTLPAPTPYRVGDRRTFRMDGPAVEAELIHVTEHTYTWLVSDANVNRQALIDAADRFERDIYPTVRHYFGSEWSPGVDNDSHLSILHYRDPDDTAAGYFSPSDELPGWIDGLSNETEMFYINLDGMNPGEEFYFAVLAHEFQHMIHWNLDRNEADWLDEGLAELACRFSGFDPGSSDEAFFRNPDTQLNDWPWEGNTTVHYGSGYLFALYLWEQFGDDFIWDLTHRAEDGLQALDVVLAEHTAGLTVDEVFARWVVVNAVNEGDYAYVHEAPKVNLRIDATHDAYPATRQTTVLPYGTDYLELDGTGTFDLHFEGTPQAQLLPVLPHTGETVWWSNDGNRSDARLIRQFDLSGLSSATMRFWVWYDLERGYDYVYLSASRDGQTWQALDTQHATARADYGPAYNGESGAWLEDTVDLSDYTGGDVWIRFDYVTDDSINGAGFLIDDVAIPEIGFFDPCDDVEGWQAEGFVLVGPTVPQRWLVQLIAVANDGTVEVERMALDEAQAGDMEIVLGSHVDRALVAISALARGSKEPATYSYEIIGP
jgi:hypothetical protein